MRLVVYGAGYVGLVSGTCFSELGHDVLIVDRDEHRVRGLREGRLPIYEPGLGELVTRNVRAGRLAFEQKVTAPFDDSDVYFIAVGTPPSPDGSADLSAVHAVAEEVKRVAKRPAIVAVKSTVPVGTCDGIQSAYVESGCGHEVVSNPEFLKEGAAVADFFRPDRVVVGARSPAASSQLRALYAPLQIAGECFLAMDSRSSELTKYAANAMLATRISFMNELARLCRATGANVHSVRAGVGTDSRIGKRYLHAGPGYGGSCLPKDVMALAALGRSHGVRLRVAEAVHEANEEQSTFLLGLVQGAMGSVAGRRIALWGLAFKPETDDVREAASLKVARALLERGAHVIGHDPEASANFSRAMGGRVPVVDRDYDALDGAHGLLLLTEWRSYRAPHFEEMRRRMVPAPSVARPIVIDGRNLWAPADVVRANLHYVGVGVPG